MGFHAARVCRHETRALLVCRQRDGADWIDRGICGGRRLDDGSGTARSISISYSFSDVGVSAGVCRLWNSRGPLAIPHLGAHRPCRRTDGGFHVARRCGDEAGCLWMLARRDGVISTWAGRMGLSRTRLWLVARCLRTTCADWHCVRRDGGAGAKGLQICHWLLERQPYGLRAAWTDDLAADRSGRCGPADVLARHSRWAAVCRGWKDGLRPHAHTRPV